MLGLPFGVKEGETNRYPSVKAGTHDGASKKGVHLHPPSNSAWWTVGYLSSLRKEGVSALTAASARGAKRLPGNRIVAKTAWISVRFLFWTKKSQ